MAFRGKVAVVTGGGSGMGQRFSERMAAQGVQVAAIDVNEEGLTKTAATSDLITTFVTDVTDTDAVTQVIEKVTADLGPIDRVVAAAGIMPSGALSEMDVATNLKVMRVNYDGVVNVVQAALPAMLERRTGDVVMFSSLMGHQPQLYLGAYCASKFAVKAYAEILYHENVDSGLRFACVCPPAVKTPLMNQLEDKARSFLTVLPDRTQLTADRVIDAIEDDLEKGRFWVMPGIAKPAALYYKLAPRLFWKGSHSLDAKNNAGR